MKYLFTLMCVVYPFCSANAQQFAQLMKDAKAQLLKERTKQLPDTSNYKAVVTLLEKAVKMQPDNAEAHYFLGYAYDYDHSGDAGTMINLQLARTQNASREFETVLRLNPRYTGEIVVLDPYSKLSSIWGSQAMCYLWHGQKDSATWAFKEGKKRGGFSEFSLAYYRFSLQHCGKNAIYFHMGDYSTFSAWYLQQVENCRTDVRIVNPGMLQLPWYSTFLYQRYPDLFSSADVATDTMLYAEGKEKVMSIPVKESATYLNWTLYPDLGPDYILRSSLLYADILEKNAFHTPVYYEHGFDSATTLGLNVYLQPGVVADEMMPYRFETPAPSFYDSLMAFPLKMLQWVNTNSNGDISAINQLRYSFFIGVRGLREEKKNKEAKQLLDYLVKNVPEAKYPLGTSYNEIIDYLKNEQ